MSANVRIFCVDHRPDGPCNPLGLTTIGVGANRQRGILHDNDGENIAAHNPHLNESTALWWLWRHPEVRRADFVGLCHYRRFLLFRPLPDRRGRVSSRLGGVFLKPSLQTLLPRLPCSEADAAAVLEGEGTDGILPVSGWIHARGGLAQAMLDNRFASERWISHALGLVREMAPACADFYEAMFRHGDRFYPYNTFVARTALFERICATLLPISLSLAEAWLRDPGAKVSRREPGFITEFLVGTYWRWLEETGQARFSHCQCVAFLRNGHGRWYLPFSRLGYRFFPDSLASAGSRCHRWLVRHRLMPHP